MSAIIIPFPASPAASRDAARLRRRLTPRSRLSEAAMRHLVDMAVRDLGLDRASAEAIAFAPPREAACDPHEWGHQFNEHVASRSAWLLLQLVAAEMERA